MLTITVTDGPRKGDTAEAVAGETLVIGRRGAWLKLADPRSSRQHAEVRPAGDGYELVDLGSTNGTFVNGQRIESPTPIGEGDMIRIGRTHLAVSTMLPTTPAAASPAEPAAAEPTPADPAPAEALSQAEPDPAASDAPTPAPSVPADDALPSPNLMDDPPAPASPADSVSAWDELELSPWEDGDDLASLLSDDEDDAPKKPAEAGEAAASTPAEAPEPAGGDDDAKPGGVSLAWAGLLLLLIPAGIWGGAELGVIDVAPFVARSAESAASDDEQAPAIEEAAVAEPEAEPRPDVADDDVTELIDVAPPGGEVEVVEEAMPDAWLEVTVPGTEPSAEATATDTPRIQTLMDGPRDAPQRTAASDDRSLDEVLVDLAGQAPPPAFDEEPAIARAVEVDTMDLAIIAEQAARSQEAEDTPAAPAADDLATALTELDPSLAVVTTADGQAESARFVEVQVAGAGDATPSAVDPAASQAEVVTSVPTADASPTVGRSVVYLVDVSGSMIDSFGAVAGWVVSDLEGLAIQDRFAVITFRNGEAVEMDPAGLKMPSVRRRTEVDTFLRPGTGPIIPGGRSDVLPAIEAAAAFAPDRLVIVSDNSLNRRTPEALAAIDSALRQLVADRPGLRVDGVQLFYDDPRGLLGELASRFNGRFVKVTPEDDPDAGNPIERLLR